MDGIYHLLVKTTLAAAFVLTVVTLGTTVMLKTAALIPMLVLAVAAAAYARWRIQKVAS
ncbi:MAG TPA: hypothetical protein VHL52_05240 [Acidimicrobiia bacterium]|jgi:hypothetical protein|nr:hypothetical protein [Acidimicrobiia bacterium]